MQTAMHMFIHCTDKKGIGSLQVHPVALVQVVQTTQKLISESLDQLLNGLDHLHKCSWVHLDWASAFI